VTGIRELGQTAAISPAAELVWVSVVGRRTQLDVALPLDVSVATLVPELVRLVCSRDVEVPSDASWPAARHSIWVLSRLQSTTPLQPNTTLRSAGVSDGELLHLTEQSALSAPILYDDVVDAAARLNKAAYAGWNAQAARWTAFGGIAIASLAWVYFVVAGPRRVVFVGLAAVLVAAMVAGAALAHRWYGQADVGAAVGWSTIPISAAIVWVLAAPLGGYGVAAGCALLVVQNAAWYWVVGTGWWGYLASGVCFAGSGLAVLAHTLGVSARTVGAVLAVTAVLACPTIPRLTGRLARVEPFAAKSGSHRQAAKLENPFTPEPSSTGAAAGDSLPSAMPTAEVVWARVHAAAVAGSALYAGLGVSVLCAVATMLRVEPHVDWPALVFVVVCAAALGGYAQVPDTALERVSLGVPAVALIVGGCMSSRAGTAAMAWTGFTTMLVVAVVASVTGLRVAGAKWLRQWASAWAYLRYVAFAALIPVALWAVGNVVRLEIW
jgi:type VII secretion integral membrane protein EccD